MAQETASTGDRPATLRALLGGSAIVFTARVAGAVFTFGTQVLLARWLGAAELGVYVFAFSWCLLLGTLAQLGFGAAAVRFVASAQSHGDVATLKGFLCSATAAVAAGSVALGLLGVAAAVVLHAQLPGGEAAPFVIASLAVPALAYLHFFGGVANGFGWLGLAFVPANALRPALAAAVIVVVGYLVSPIDAVGVLLIQAAVAFACAAALGLAMLALMGPRRLATVRPHYQTNLWARTALPLLLVTLFVHYFPEFNVLVLGFYVPSHDIAVFSAAYRVAFMIAFGLSAVDALVMPAAAQLFTGGDKTALQAVTARASKLRFWGALSGVLLLTVFGEQLLGLFGEDFKAGYRALVLLSLAQLVHGAVGPVTALLSVTGHQQRCLAVFGCALLASFVLTALLVPAFGIDGAAAGVLLVTVGWSLWLYRTVRARLDIRASAIAALVPRWIWKRTGAL